MANRWRKLTHAVVFSEKQKLPHLLGLLEGEELRTEDEALGLDDNNNNNRKIGYEMTWILTFTF